MALTINPGVTINSGVALTAVKSTIVQSGLLLNFDAAT